MRILLDAKDLIDLIEFNRPVEITAFSAWLKKGHATLVLSVTNVSDFVGPVFDRGDLLKMRVLFETAAGPRVSLTQDPIWPA